MTCYNIIFCVSDRVVQKLIYVGIFYLRPPSPVAGFQ